MSSENTDIEKYQFLKNELLIIGLNHLLEYNESYLQEILKFYPELINSNLSKLNVNYQIKIISSLYKNNPLQLSSDFYKKYIEECLQKFEDSDEEYLHTNNYFFVLINRIKDLYEPVNWFNVFCKISESCIKVGIQKLPESLTLVLNWLVDYDDKYLIKILHRSETKHYPRGDKETLYKRLIELGYLDTKISRRIRGDTSGELSMKVLSYLFLNRSKYSDDDFKNLITQFTDTKHKWVARYISLNMPMDLIPFLFGLDDDQAMSILQKRMQV